MQTVKSLPEFIEEHGISAEVEWADENPNMVSDQPMNHWLVTLKAGDATMEVPFSQGLGLTEEPTAADVLDCLASDAAMASEYEDGIELAVSLGETIETQEDVDRARHTFEVIEQQTRELCRILGDGPTEELLYNIERL